MGMRNPHHPEQELWSAIVHWNEVLSSDPHNEAAADNFAYYTDQWFKQCEKLVVLAMREHKVKNTVGDRMPKPKADKLTS